MNIKNVSYNMILSHTFPGILLECEILLAFQLFSPSNIINKVSAFAQANVSNIVFFFALFFVLATIFGVILDGIHHLIFRKQENETYGIYKYITSLERMQIVRGLLDDDFWYPYEAYANIWISMTPGLILLPYWMVTLQFHLAFVAGIMAVYVAVFELMRREAISTLKMYKKTEIELIEAFKGTQPNPHRNVQGENDDE